MTETVSTPALAPLESMRRVRAGATASPRPVSKRPEPSRRMTVRTARAAVAAASSRSWIRSRSPASIAAERRTSCPIWRAAASARSWNSRNSPEAERWASNSRASVLPCSESDARTNPTVATTTIGRMTRTMKKMVRRLRKLIRAPGDRPG